MLNFGKSVPRRTFLRGAGITMALPLLDAMIPAFAQGSAAQPVKRLSIVYLPNGRIMDRWTPTTVGTGFELPPLLEPLAPFRDRFAILSGLSQEPARVLPGQPVGVHERPLGAYLTGVRPRWTAGTDFQNGISLDQIVANEFRKYTQLGSLEVTLDPAGIIGACERGWSCAYINTLSWQSPTTPLPMEHNPRKVFERLFGDLQSTDSREQSARFRMNRSILDSVSEAMAALVRQLGPSDRTKLSEYTHAIRDIERRIEMAEKQGPWDLPSVERPTGTPPTYQEHAKLTADLLVLAFQADITRVNTFMMGREKTNRAFPEIGVSDAHHAITHHGGDQEKIEKVVKIETLQSQMFAYYLDRLQSTPDGDGSLLDNSIVTCGSAISDGNSHDFQNLPVLVFGAGAGQIKGGRHLKYPIETPVTNLYLTLLEKMGLPMEEFGDSTGQLNLLSV